MSKVYIRKGIDGEFENYNLYIAYSGFKQLGFEIRFFTTVEEIKDNNIEDIIVGGIGETRKILESFNKKYPELNYPMELRKYMGRNCWQETLGNIINNPNNWGVFIKPVLGCKSFTGTVISKIEDLRAVIGVDTNTLIWCTDVVNFVSEWRCFIRYGGVVGVKHYNGDWSKSINFDILNAAVTDYKDAPNAYVIDLGVTDKGETLLVEVNDGYSVGCYGLHPVLYAKFLSARWSELMGVEDFCNF